MREIRGGITYFILVYAAGWMLGPIRQFLVVPRLGETVAVMLEAPLMLAAIGAAALWVTRRFTLPSRLGARLAMGLVALALLLLAEAAAAVWLRGIGLAGYLARFATPPGVITLLLFLVFAVMPALVARRG